MRTACRFVRHSAWTAVLLSALFLSSPCHAAPFFSCDGLLLGAFINGEWVSDGDLQQNKKYHASRIWGGEEVRLYSLLKHEGGGIACALSEDHPEKEMPRDPGRVLAVQAGQGKTFGLGCALLAVSGNKDALPRKPAVLGKKNSTYREAVKEYLETCGVQGQAPAITQIFRVDLEGDGADEVLIAAQNLLPAADSAFLPENSLWKTAKSGVLPARKKDGYSVVLLRRLTNGRVETVPLAETLPGSSRSAPTLYKISQFADLNGDGIMEIILSHASASRFGCSVYGPGKKPIKKLSQTVQLP